MMREFPRNLWTGRLSPVCMGAWVAITGLVWLITEPSAGGYECSGSWRMFLLLSASCASAYLLIKRPRLDWFWCSLIALALLKIYLTSGLALCAIGDSDHDDSLFIKLADSLRTGHWLGPYSNRTLAKGPGFPLWVAFSARIGLPLFLTENLLYVAACFALVVGLQLVVRRRWALLCIYAVLLFNPMTYSESVLRVSREGIYPAQTLLVLAGLVGLHTRRHHAVAVMARWAMLLGVAFAWFWLTREEAVWFVPSLALLLGVTAIAIWKGRESHHALRLGLCVVPLFIWGMSLLCVCTINRVKYKVFTTCEFRWKPFLKAYGSLARVEQHPWQRYVPVPKETRQRIYAVSPAFRELEPYLEGQEGRDYAHCGAFLLPNGGSEPEIAGGWFMWAFRDAVSLAGHYGNGKSARAYYLRLAAEVNHACEVGLLPAGPNRSTMLPPWRNEYGGLLFRKALDGIQFLASFQRFHVGPEPSTGERSALSLFEDLTHGRLALPANVTPPPERRVDEVRMAVLSDIGWLYQLLTPWATAAAAAGFVICLGSSLYRSRCSYRLVVAMAAFLGVIARVLLLAMMDITTVPAMGDLYLAAAYPLLLLFIALQLTDISNSLPEKRKAPPDEVDSFQSLASC